MIRKIVLESLEELNKVYKKPELTNITNESLIYDNLDSMGILDLIIEIEGRLQKHYGEFIQIADDSIMDEVKTPFKTFESLIHFVEKKVD